MLDNTFNYVDLVNLTTKEGEAFLVFIFENQNMDTLRFVISEDNSKEIKDKVEKWNRKEFKNF